MTSDKVRLSKAISMALRHKPWLFDLELDAEGWTSLDALLQGLQQFSSRWEGLSLTAIEEMVATQQKQRFEIAGAQIRALYGHSLAARIQKVPAPPPPQLYHGTSQQTLPIIQAEGLRPMRRQYVHLALDTAMAREVGSRKGGDTVILRIAATAAHAAGVVFYMGNEQVWLADSIPPAYIHMSG